MAVWNLQDAIASDEDLELDSPFMDAGMDSLSSVALMSMVAKAWRCIWIILAPHVGEKCCQEFQMALSPSLVFDFPTLRPKIIFWGVQNHQRSERHDDCHVNPQFARAMEEHLVTESLGM